MCANTSRVSPTLASWIARHTRSGGERHVDVADAEVRHRVDDRVLHRGRRADRARLADALRAERVERASASRCSTPRSSAARPRSASRSPCRLRGERVAVVVVDDALEQRLRDALRDAAVLLARDEQRVEDPAAVVDRDVAEQLDAAGLAVDLDDGDVRAEREGRVALVEVELVRRAPGSMPVGRASSGPSPRAASSAQRQRARGHAGDADRPPSWTHDVVGVRLEQVTRRARWPSRAPPRWRGPDRAARRSAATASPSCRCPAGRARCRTGRAARCPSGTPSSSATIIANAVSWPWPCADVPTVAVTVPSVVRPRPMPYSENRPPAVTST